MALKYFENEAELGSDNEENDEERRNVNANDYEEILDKKLELLDEDLKDLIDDSDVEEDNDNLAARLLEENIADDKQNTINVIKAMAMKSRLRNTKDHINIDDETDDQIWNRMRQRELELEGRDQENQEEIKERIK